jgi:hypothetical protein
MPRLPAFGAHHEQAEIASRLHSRAELELGLSDPESVELQRLASGLELERGPTFLGRLTAGFDRFFKRRGEGS